MTLESLSIKNYCGFTKEQIIEFAKSDGKRIGSGLTLITGENKTGKSTLIRALQGFTEKVEILSDKYFGKRGEIKLTLDNDNKIYFKNEGI